MESPLQGYFLLISKTAAPLVQVASQVAKEEGSAAQDSAPNRDGSSPLSQLFHAKSTRLWLQLHLPEWALAASAEPPPREELSVVVRVYREARERDDE